MHAPRREFHCFVIPDAQLRIAGALLREPGIQNHERKYEFRACANWRIRDAQLRIGNDGSGGRIAEAGPYDFTAPAVSPPTM
jgi:hypothetical protein